MENEPKHQLVIWFDRKQAGIDALYHFVNSGLNPTVIKNVGYSTDGYLTLSISGNLVDVDTGHSQIIEFIERSGWNHFRLIDTAGDEIRQKAYLELSNIEQELRAFINRGLIDAFGFNWWLSLGSLKIPGLENPEYRKNHHLLELMTIEELIDFVTFEKAELNDDSPILLKDLSTILDQSASFEDFRNKLKQKANKVSLWDLVFSKYLGDSAISWQEIRRKDLQFIIDLRNRVMHHRPVHFGELKALDEKKNRISSLIASTKTHLSDDEKRDIATQQKKAREIFAKLVYERTNQNPYFRLHQSFTQSRNISTVENLINELTLLTTSGGITRKEALELRATAFRQLETLTDFSIEKTKEIIINELLPLCLQDEPDLNMHGHTFREILVDWLDGHPEQDAYTLKNLVLDNLAKQLGTVQHRPACWTISRIGYARTDIVQILFDHGNLHDDEVGDTSLSTITWLCFSKDQRQSILVQLHDRAEKRYNNTLLWSLSRLADPTSIAIIFDAWLTGNQISEKKVDPALAFTALREIADANENDVALQDQIWERTIDLIESKPEELYFDLDIGHLVTTCNSALVVPTILNWQAEHPDWFKNPGWARYLAQERLESAVKPLQLDGWLHVNEPKFFDLLEEDVSLDTKNDNFYTTQETMTKESTWKTLFRAGHAPLMNLFDIAISNETGRFMRRTLMEYLAVLKFEPLPQSVVRWITEEYNDVAKADGRELSQRMAAVRLARSSGSREAFDVLLNFGYTRDGQILQQSADAVIDVALSLLRDGNIEIIEHLVDRVTGNKKHQRVVAIAALEAIGTFEEYLPLLTPYRDRFISIVHEEDLENIERGQVLNIISLLPGDFTQDFENDLRNWAHNPDRWISVGALQALTRHGILEADTELMKELLSLEREGESWKISVLDSMQEWASYIIGLLYQRNINAFSNVINTLVINKDWNSAIQIFGWLDLIHGEQGKTPVPKEITDALVRRLVGKMSRFYTETDAFELLAKIEPDALLQQEIIDALPAWMSDSYIALANALRTAKVSAEFTGKRLMVLESLTENGMYSVRRSAYRALATHSSVHLYGLCKSWFESPILKLNLRAAEASGWIDNVTIDGKDGFQELQAIAISHPEANVRNAFKLSYDARRRRNWAKTYLDRILSATGQDNSDVLNLWRYGDALSKVGDDEIRDVLHNYLSKNHLPSNIRFWIRKHIIEKLENNWKKVTQKWPEPWLDSSGAIERGTGRLTLPSTESIDVQYSVWLSPASTPMEKHSWGGNIVVFWGDVMNIDQATIELEDGRKGEIQFSGINGNTATFHGRGRYPT